MPKASTFSFSLMIPWLRPAFVPLFFTIAGKPWPCYAISWVPDIDVYLAGAPTTSWSPAAASS